MFLKAWYSMKYYEHKGMTSQFQAFAAVYKDQELVNISKRIFLL